MGTVERDNVRKWIKLTGVAVIAVVAVAAFVVFGFLDQSSPRKLPKPAISRANLGVERVTPKIVPGGLHLVVLAGDGSLWGVGYNDHGQAGGSNTGQMKWTTQFEQFKGGLEWVDVAVTDQATLAIRRDGTLWQWGAIADGLRVDAQSAPAQIGSSTNWVKISGASQRILARQHDGTLWSWGGNLNGDLGDGTRNFRINPAPINADSDWADGSCGPMVNVGVKTNGSLWIWGHVFHQDQWLPSRVIDLGVHRPFRVGGKTGWVRAECMVDGIVAQQSDSSLWRLGYGELQRQTNWIRLPDVPGGLRSWSASAFTLTAVNSTGKIWVLGQNRFGLLTKRFTRESELWVPVEGIEHAVSAGSSSVGAGVITQRGELVVWGRRYDDSSGDAIEFWPRLQLQISRLIPQFKPKSFASMSGYEITPWVAFEFKPTNSAVIKVEKR